MSKLRLCSCFVRRFRPKEKAKCFAGDVGSLGAAFILLFVIGLKVMVDMDPTWLVFLIVYGIDGVTLRLSSVQAESATGSSLASTWVKRTGSIRIS